MVALSFSGGGTRAAAFSYGVLAGFDETPTPGRAASLLNRIDFVTGVSGGSVLAAYYGLKKRAALADFKQRFLLRNAEESLPTNLNLLSLAKGLQGGINDPTLFPQWLDDNLYEGATFKTLRYQRRPSSRSMLPISTTARRSSSAPRCLAPCAAISPTSRSRSLSRHRRRCRWRSLPSSFGYPGGCPMPLPHWVHRVRSNPNAPPLLRNFANAMYGYRSGEVRYVKLLDGGIVELRACRLHHRAACLRNSLRAAAARRGRETATYAVSGRRCGSRAVGRLVADRGRPLRRQPDYSDLRHCDQSGAVGITVVPRYDEQLAGGADRLAL